jgi:hypothetical protein
VSKAEPLRNEITLFESKRQQWLSSYRDQFVVIAGEQIAGFFPDFEEAFKAGVQAFGITRPFLVKQVCVTDPVYPVF